MDTGDSHAETQQQQRYFTGGCENPESWLDKQSDAESDTVNLSAAVDFCCLVSHIDTLNPLSVKLFHIKQIKRIPIENTKTSE